MTTETLTSPLSRMRPLDQLESREPRRTTDGRLDLAAYLRAGRERRRRRALVAQIARRIARTARHEAGAVLPEISRSLAASGA